MEGGGGKHPPPSATTRQKSPVLTGLTIAGNGDLLSKHALSIL